MRPPNKTKTTLEGLSARVLAVIWLALVFSLAWVAGAIAQGEGAAVTITGIESQAFPQVTVSVAVADENGPLTGLTAADFQIFEDGREVPATNIAVVEATLQDLRLVLALDTSMPGNDLAKVQAAAKTWLSSMGPRDRVAVISFADDVSLGHDFTNNTAELQTVIDNLTAGGNRTALHQALVEATTMIGQPSAGRQAVVVVTDSRDNTGILSVDEIIGQAQEARVPLYIVGFGDKVRTDSLKDKVKLTGGQYFTLPNADQVQTTLQEIEQQLRQGYQITFPSGLKADNVEHKLTIAISHQGNQGQAEDRFVAVPGQVVVILPNLAEGQTVGGLVNLTPEITAPAPLTSVQYLLDGQSLAEITTPPYRFEWDSTTVEAGSHTLTVDVVDSAGNKGQAELSLNVVVPVKVAISTPRTEIEVGDEIIIQSKIEAIEELVQVELLLDDNLVASDDTPPYSFSLDSSEYPAGAHAITMRAEDRLGRQGTAELRMQFLAPPAPEPPLWLRVVEWFRSSRQGQYLVTGLKWGAAVLVIIAIAVIGLVLIARAQKRGPQEIYHLSVINLGNVPSRYQLRAEDPVGGLKFQFILHGAKLPQQAVPQTTRGVRQPTAPIISLPPAVAVAPPTSSSAPPASPAAGGGVRQTAGKAKQTSSSVMGLTSFIGEMLRTLSYLLPGSAGRSVENLGRRVSEGRRTVSYATYRPQQMARAADRLRDQAGRVVPSTSRTETAAGRVAQPKTGPSVPPGGTGVGFDRTGTGGPARPTTGRRETVVTNGRQAVTSLWSQTPLIDPGETLTIDLLIAPRKPHRTQRYSFKVLSKAIESESAPLVVEEGSIQIKGRSWFRRLIPYLLFAMIIVVIVLSVIFLVMNLDIVGQYLREGLSRLGSIVGMSGRH